MTKYDAALNILEELAPNIESGNLDDIFNIVGSKQDEYQKSKFVGVAFEPVEFLHLIHNICFDPDININLLENTKHVPRGLFALYDLPANFKIPNQITTIGKSAFVGGTHRNLVLPAGVTKIERFAFANTYLDLTFTSLPKSIDLYAFDGSTGTIYIPGASEDDYKAFLACFDGNLISVNHLPNFKGYVCSTETGEILNL